MEKVFEVVALVCSIAVWIRFRRYLSINRRMSKAYSDQSMRVSIIIPARNESENIGRLLTSLLQLEKPPHEIIVVDDGSEDHTYQLAESYGVRVIKAGDKPPGWAGKTWASDVGARHATGEVLLFTDADTRHLPDSLRRAVAFLARKNADMISSPSYHINKNWWEKLLGPFYCLIHAGASPYDNQSVKSPYALGQYIMIRRNAYEKVGGFASIRQEVAEDAAFARLVMQNGCRYLMHRGQPLFTVQMYSSFRTFFAGWVRMMRIGMQQLSAEVVLNTFIPLFAFNVWNLDSGRLLSWVPVIITLTCFALVQRRIGNFSILGVILFPISLALFIVIGLWSGLTHLLNVPIEWRGRVYRLSRRMPA
jgi:4,4'-diaponeurosporenoate glycosyltransferase